MSTLWIFIKVSGWVFATALVLWMLVRFHRWLIYLEDSGYINYRNRPRGGSGQVFMEMDKFTRPSIEHVQRSMDAKVESQENDGE